jgi:hypothetical protein
MRDLATGFVERKRTFKGELEPLPPLVTQSIIRTKNEIQTSQDRLVMPGITRGTHAHDGLTRFAVMCLDGCGREDESLTIAVVGATEGQEPKVEFLVVSRPAGLEHVQFPQMLLPCGAGGWKCQHQTNATWEVPIQEFREPLDGGVIHTHKDTTDEVCRIKAFL